MAQRIIRPETAFSIGKSRDVRFRRSKHPKHLAWIRTLPCLISMLTRDVDAAHIRYADKEYGKEEPGMARKPDDFWVVPLEHSIHLHEQHAMNERAFWEKYSTDPLRIALALFAVSGDDDAGMEILHQNWRARRLITIDGVPK